MGFWHNDREPQPQPMGTREPLVNLNVEPPQPEKTHTGFWSRRKRSSGTETKNSAAQPQPPAKAHRRSLALGETKARETPSPSQPPSEPRRPRLADASVASQDQESVPRPGRSRGAITHPCDYLPEVQNIIDPPRLVTDASAQAPQDTASERRPEPGPRRARLALDTPAAPEEPPSTPAARRSRGAVTHRGDDPPGLQDIIDPPQSASSVPAPAATEKPPEPTAAVDPAKVQQFVAELRAKQSFSTALIGGLAVAMIAATAWALVTTATNYQIGWMAVGVGFLVGGAVRTLGRGIDKSFGYLGAAMSVFGCLLGNLLSICAIVAGHEGLSLVSVLAHVCAQPAVIPGAMLATFQPMDLLFYGIAVYEGYRFSFRQVTDAEISRALCRK